MLDHVGFPVSNYKRSKGFYMNALAPLGYELVIEVNSEHDGDKAHAGFGTKGRPRFWIGAGIRRGARPSAFSIRRWPWRD